LNVLACVFDDGQGRHLAVFTEDNQSALTAVDYGNDGRFDEINLKALPKGHKLESYANVNKLEQIYVEITK